MVQHKDEKVLDNNEMFMTDVMLHLQFVEGIQITRDMFNGRLQVSEEEIIEQARKLWPVLSRTRRDNLKVVKADGKLIITVRPIKLVNIRSGKKGKV